MPRQLRLLANLGDVNFEEYGGTLVFERENGEAFAEHYDADERTVWSYDLDRYKHHGGYLVPEACDESWPHPVHMYEPWFAKKLSGIAATVGMSKRDLETLLTSKDPVKRADGYDAVASTYGYAEFDQDPLKISKRDAKRRYGSL
jgi:hypothetical protein